VRILLLGGPKFVGRAVIDAALERGHEVTLFNRGTTGADLYPELERIIGDRVGGLDGLRGREWDAVVDTSGYVPRVVGASAGVLSGMVGHYVFVSSISVYASFADVVDERSPLAELSGPGSDDISADYGALKALCEREVDAALPGRSMAVRAGLIVGPHDPTGRFTYWPHRVSRGGDVLVPGPAWRPVQLVDVRDLATWMVTAAENGLAGPFNATGPATMGAVIDAAKRVSGSSARAVEVDDAFLAGQGVGEWMELPLWIDTSNDEWRHFMEVDASHATAAGLTFRPLDDTVRATLGDAGLVDGVGLAPDRERELLDAWWSRGTPTGREPEASG
jgi:2'-hydroxyisoflavone reductase